MSSTSDLLTRSAAAEVPVIAAVQSTVGTLPAAVPVSRAMSHFGEHALGWLAVAGVGAAADPARRGRWLSVGVAAFGAHAASVVIKRVVRRPRPDDPQITVGVGTPSRLSFPSSHATGAAAGALLLGRITGLPAFTAVVPAMGISRLVLGVHYPTDVLGGVALGTGVAVAVDRLRGRVPLLRDRGDKGRAQAGGTR